MVRQRVRCTIILGLLLLLLGLPASAEQVGSIRGMAYDKEFEAPLPAVEVLIVETEQKVTTTDQGNYVFGQVAPGTYTLQFSKEGFQRQVKADVVVGDGQMAEVDATLAGDFTEMEEFVVQDVAVGGGGEAALLNLRLESPALMDSISADMMKRAGASDAPAALKLVTGVTVQDGKFAVVRGLPDRYVNSQMNSVRLPSADASKRAVQLDQFPAAVIDSLRVTKTFTPDQQGDASGGAVNVVLKSVPDEGGYRFEFGNTMNTQVTGHDDFLTQQGKGVNFWGVDKRPIPSNGDFRGPVGVSETDGPFDYNWSLSGGGKRQIDKDVKIGGFGDFYYKHDSKSYENGQDNSYWVLKPGAPMTPQYLQGTPSQGDFKTALYDVNRSIDCVQWGGLATVGVEAKHDAFGLTYMYTHNTTEVATLAEDTRGKAYYFPGYDPNNPKGLGNQSVDAAPYLRTETVEYTERTTQTIQLNGRHTLMLPEFKIDGLFKSLPPELDWTVAYSTAGLNQPDKTQFGEEWLAPAHSNGFPPWVPPFDSPAQHREFKPAANFTMGNLQEIWKDIEETSQQYFVNLKLPFEQWSSNKGYFKFGAFDDSVHRTYTQQSFSNFGENGDYLNAPWNVLWSSIFGSENHAITAGDVDVNYKGTQKISALYGMVDLPTSSWLDLIGGVRFEDTRLSIVNQAEKDVTWIPPGGSSPVTLKPGDADVKFSQDDALPSLGFILKPIKQVQIHGNYSETVARQTFKELTPIQQMDFLGGDIFIGNPKLQMSSVKNYDLRVDYTPYQGGLLSASVFHKDIKSPIEYVQGFAGFSYTTAVNYPTGELTGLELEARQQMGQFWKPLEGLALGSNATFIDSQVTLPTDEAATFERPGINAPMRTRDMTNAPNHLYNFYATYDLDLTKTQFGLFYTVQGDALVAGAAAGSVFVPSLYNKEYGTLNFSVSQQVWKGIYLRFLAKNLTDSTVETVYRSKYIGSDKVKSSYRLGIEFVMGVSMEFSF